VAHVELNVYSVARALRFYHDLLGFQLIGNPSEENAILSATGNGDKDYLLQLHKVSNQHRIIEDERSAIRQAGLYDFAILLPSRRHLANVFKHLTENSNQLCFEGAADHSVSESLYLRDADSNLMVSRFTETEISQSGNELANFRWR
jgi:catechol 2,3-dioxygenase